MRVKNSLKNMTTTFASQILHFVLTFATRTVFVKLLATEYWGLSGLFTNILSVLSLSELGIGNVIIVNLYKPIAENDENTICKYMNFFKKAYTLIGIFILGFGLISSPFIDYMVKTDSTIPNLKLIYLLYVVNSAVSYFFSYRSTLLIANQKEYKVVINRSVFFVLQNLIQIIILLLTKNYILFLCVTILTTITSNLSITHITNKIYPYLRKNKNFLNKSEVKGLFKGLTAMTSHKVGNVIVNSTDNIIISTILGVYITGIYSNYSLIFSIVTSFATMFFAACSASIGSFNSTESDERVYNLFKTVKFIGFWLYGFCSISLTVLIQPFISLWIGEDYKISNYSVLVIVGAFFVKGISLISGTFVDVTQLYIKTKFVPWVMAIINLVVSIVLSFSIGLSGVFLGTICGYLFTKFWIDPYILCREKFKIKFRTYSLFSLKWIIVILISGFLTYFLASLTGLFIIKAIICLFVPNILFLILFCKTKEWIYLFNSAKSILKNKGV